MYWRRVAAMTDSRPGDLRLLATCSLGHRRDPGESDCLALAPTTPVGAGRPGSAGCARLLRSRSDPDGAVIPRRAVDQHGLETRLRLECEQEIERRVLEQATGLRPRPGRLDAGHRITDRARKIFGIDPHGRGSPVFHPHVGLKERFARGRSRRRLFAKPLSRHSRLESRLQSLHGNDRVAHIQRRAHVPFDVARFGSLGTGGRCRRPPSISPRARIATPGPH
jgi:hypothetical protein